MARSERIETFAKSIDAIAVRGSIGLPDDLQRLVNTAIEAHGRIDAVVNSSGHPPSKPLLDLTDQDWAEQFELMFLSVVRLTRLVTPIMMEQNGGAWVNISGNDPFEPPLEPFPLASAMRAAMGNYAKQYADRYVSSGIRMNTVCPSVVSDRPIEKLRPDLKQLPVGRPARTREIADLVDYLLSDRAAYITGQHIRIDGGEARSL